MDCWPVILHVLHHTRRVVTHHVGHRLARHTITRAHMVKLIVCSGAALVPAPIPADDIPPVITLPPTLYWPAPPAELPLLPGVCRLGDITAYHPIPEPSALFVLGLPGLALILLRRRA